MKGIKLSLVLVVIFLLSASVIAETEYRSVPASFSSESASCVECHESSMPGMVKEWRYSRHYGADVGCYECHAAEETDADAFEHNGYNISVIVSPREANTIGAAPATMVASTILN